MFNLFTFINIVLLVLFFLSILIVNIDGKNKQKGHFNLIGTNWISKILALHSLILPLLIPYLLYLVTHTYHFIDSMGILITSLLIFGIIIYQYRVVVCESDSGLLDKSNLFGFYNIVLNFGFKFPILVIFYNYFLERFFGNIAFLILVILMTISGLLYISNGFKAFNKTAAVSFIAFISGFIILTVFIEFPDYVFTPIIFPQIITNKLLYFFPFILGLVGVWYNEFYPAFLNDTADDVQELKKVLVTAVSYLIIIAVISSILLMTNKHFALFWKPVIDVSLNLKLLSLLMISGPFIMGMMTIFRSTSDTISNYLYNHRSLSANKNIHVLRHRLVIVALVAIAVLLTPVINQISIVKLRTLLVIYIVFSIPVTITLVSIIIKDKVKLLFRKSEAVEMFSNK